MIQTKIKNKRKSPPSETPARLTRLARETLVIALVALTGYLLICLVSYSPLDPAWTSTGDDGSTRNLGGRFGAWFADLFLHAFGYAAYLFPVIFGLLSARMLRNRDHPSSSYARFVHGIGIALTVLSACGIEYIHFTNGGSDNGFSGGGWLGFVSGGWLFEVFGPVGATVALIVALIAGLSWTLDLSWFSAMDNVGAKAFEWAARARAALVDWLDKVKGLRSRRQRQETVAEIRREREHKEPPRIEPKIKPAKEGLRLQKEKQATIPLFIEGKAPQGNLPALKLLDQPQVQPGGYSKDSLEMMSRLVEKKLRDFNVEVTVVSVQPGPVITRFEIDPAAGIKASQIVGLSRDMARALSVVSVRVVENIPGKTYIGIEIPNESRETVFLLEGLASAVYETSKSPLTLILGKDIAGEPVVSDLCKMPHLLVAGTTGSGKSVCVNAIILSILYKSTPEDVRLIMVDPKMLELSVYDGIPHLLTPVVTDMQKAANALRWCIVEMDRRFRIMAALGVRNIVGYNRKVEAAIASGKPIDDPMYSPIPGDDSQTPTLAKIPYIVVIVDEFADLMMVAGKKIEELITRIAQRARAAGIHLVLATQRPSVDVVTGLIKANIPTRIAFQVSARADSRTVLDQMGAEQLLGHGDMLFMPPGTGLPMRVHGSFVSDQEVHRVAEEIRKSGSPEYLEAVVDSSALAGALPGGDSGDGAGGEEDPLYDKALAFVTETRRASISSVQRHLRVGYNRAARMIESMEAAGAVGPLENGKREVIAPATSD